MKKLARKFTLMELLIVIALMALTLGLSASAVGAIRSGKSNFNKVTSSFQEFMATARRQAMLSEYGAAVVLTSTENFSLEVKLFDEEGELVEDQYPLRWNTTSEDFEVNYSKDLDETVPIFTFYPDGTGKGLTLTFTLKGYASEFYLSPLTGTCLQKEKEVL